MAKPPEERALTFDEDNLPAFAADQVDLLRLGFGILSRDFESPRLRR
jgi:hypothetical protein